MTGMRRGEALGLRWEDLDMGQGSLSIRRALVPVNGVAQISEPKTRRGRRTIAIDPETLGALKAHAAR
jgi:integrase